MKKFIFGAIFGAIVVISIVLTYIADQNYQDFVSNQEAMTLSVEMIRELIFIPIILPTSIAFFLAGIVLKTTTDWLLSLRKKEN